MANQDPYYIVKQEITDAVTELSQKVSRFHGLTAANPERKKLSFEVFKGCDNLFWQLNELDNAVDRASENPARFNLTPEELSTRRRWIGSTRRQLEGIKDALRTAEAKAQEQIAAKEAIAAAKNDRFLNTESTRQQLLIKEQDQDLDDIEGAVMRIGRQARTIGVELEEQSRMLDGLDGDVDTTHTRLKAAQKKMQEIIRKSSSKQQFVVIIVLIVILVIMSALAFY